MHIQNGAKPLKRDSRDYSFHRTFGAVMHFDENLDVDAKLSMPDQNADGFPFGCTGYTTSEICSDFDKSLYDPAYTYKKTLLIENQETDGPCEIRDSLNSSRVYGVLPKGAPWDDSHAAPHRRGSYYLIENSSDWFDSIRSAVLMNKSAVSVGTPWFPEWEITHNGYIAHLINTDTTGLSWHNWKVSGWKTINGVPYLIGKTWQGSGYGDGGLAYFSREVVNRVFDIKGSCAFVLLPYTPQDVVTVKMSIYEVVIDYLQRILEIMKNTMPAKLSYDTPKQAWHAVRVTCDSAGMTLAEKNELCACIYQESGFHKDAVGKMNSNGTIDYGICQFNNGKNKSGDALWIGPGAAFSSIQEVLGNPQKCVDVMVSEFKAGHKNYWASYSTGAYKKWLDPNSPMWILAK